MPSWSKIARRIRVPLGFAAAAAFLLLAHPAKLSILIGSAVAIAGLVIRALASGHVRKNEVLTITGPYGYTRNPLYFGSLMFFAIYLPVIRSEEEFLRMRFPEFGEYERNVPRLFPRFTPYQSSSNSFHWHLYWKHREYNAAVGAAVLIAILILKAHWFGT
ncbi:MAG: isoprenylcysteine carboxylmethyltransferase family protein [Acidobacteria bacterium]|nr:MAG: isoprenylcysteine carboxylmethyltransferase family protein [Acidobacteriota bacterium]